MQGSRGGSAQGYVKGWWADSKRCVRGGGRGWWQRLRPRGRGDNADEVLSRKQDGGRYWYIDARLGLRWWVGWKWEITRPRAGKEQHPGNGRLWRRAYCHQPGRSGKMGLDVRWKRRLVSAQARGRFIISITLAHVQYHREPVVRMEELAVHSEQAYTHPRTVACFRKTRVR